MNHYLPLVLGTRNRKKGLELLDLLRPWGIEVRTLADFPAAPEVVEDGETFLANAEKKAREMAVATGHWVLGEDSGLCVPALGGAPGVYSARYAGEPCDDAKNNARLLDEIARLPPAKRGAYYVCTAALADPQGEIYARSEGRCHGRILEAERGTGGFGYDPMFEISEYHKTFGELGPVVKKALSHRGRAMRAMLPELLKCLSE